MMFICRACRGQQRRLFSASRTLAADSPQTAFQDTLNTLRAQQPPQRSTQPRSPARSRDRITSAVSSAMQRRNPSRGGANQEQDLKSAQAVQDRMDMERQMARWWKEGDIYAPHDLSASEMSKWKALKSRGKQSRDVCDVLNVNPVDHYKNFSMMAEYVTEMGRIKGRGETGLRPINQRRMAKAIRRAVGAGLMPSVHKHPELLRLELRSAKNADFRSKR